MGDRANVIVKQYGENPPVVIYSHWGGTRLHGGAIEKALMAARNRTGDDNYFTEILVRNLMQDDLVSGVGTGLDDNEHPIIVIDSNTGEREPDMEYKEAGEFLKGFRKDKE